MILNFLQTVVVTQTMEEYFFQNTVLPWIINHWLICAIVAAIGLGLIIASIVWDKKY
jgi:hypothetical protein